MAKHSHIAASTPTRKSTVIGTYEGKSLDCNVFNENDMKLGRDVFEVLLNSDSFKRYLKLGHYIGFLGHPEDPGCQEFERACVILRDCQLLDDDTIFAKFDLVDTPVGRIVKTFIDAGVQFGISIRGAGDLVGGEVDPDTFIFRGFDLVAFPAYEDCIPTFTEIAASSDISKQSQYKKICASVDVNMKDINDVVTLETIQSQFNESSNMYKKIDSKKQSIKSATVLDIRDQKIDSVTKLYVEAIKSSKQIKSEADALRKEINNRKAYAVRATKKVSAMNRILSDQVESVLSDIKVAKSEIAKLTSELHQADRKYKTSVSANNKLKEELTSLQKDNLYYKQKVTSSVKNLHDKESIIASLKNELRETVTANSEVKSKLSNRDNKVIGELKQDVKTALALVEEYQNEYASLYASILGVGLNSIPVTATTTVKELKQLINSGTSTSGIPAVPDILELKAEDEDSNEIVSL